jgi:hypothetical protein
MYAGIDHEPRRAPQFEVQQPEFVGGILVQPEIVTQPLAVKRPAST